MLAAKRNINFRGIDYRTPMVIPSFSSKGFEDVEKIVDVASEYISEEVLVSAYDIFHSNVKQKKLSFSTLAFLDSGGYEASVDRDLSDTGKKAHTVSAWTQALHKKVLENWEFEQPTVIVSYDNPNRRQKIANQIASASALFKIYPNCVSELLLKAEPHRKTEFDKKYLPISTILESVDDLAEFDIIGVTEKELGRSAFERMKNIASLRLALTTAEKDIPIHVFGSLDPISTPLYFLAGADIFDGLTWLRYAFRNGYAVYKHNYGALHVNIETPDKNMNGHIHQRNYNYLMDLQASMRQFLLKNDFSVFQCEVEDFFQSSHDKLEEHLEASNGR